MTLNPWWVYSNPPFCIFCSQPILVYFPYRIYLSSTEPKWNTLPKNPNHYYYFEKKFTRTISFFFRQSVTKYLCQTTFSSTWGPLFPTINVAVMTSLVKLHLQFNIDCRRKGTLQFVNFWPFGKGLCHWL